MVGVAEKQTRRNAVVARIEIVLVLIHLHDIESPDSVAEHLSCSSQVRDALDADWIPGGVIDRDQFLVQMLVLCYDESGESEKGADFDDIVAEIGSSDQRPEEPRFIDGDMTGGCDASRDLNILVVHLGGIEAETG